MNKTSLILTAIMMLSLVVFMAPGVLAMNRGKILQSIALWLAIFTGLALIYKNFGPESAHPMFSVPGMVTAEPDATQSPATDHAASPTP